MHKQINLLNRTDLEHSVRAWLTELEQAFTDCEDDADRLNFIETYGTPEQNRLILCGFMHHVLAQHEDQNGVLEQDQHALIKALSGKI